MYPLRVIDTLITDLLDKGVDIEAKDSSRVGLSKCTVIHNYYCHKARLHLNYTALPTLTLVNISTNGPEKNENSTYVNKRFTLSVIKTLESEDRSKTKKLHKSANLSIFSCLCDCLTGSD